MVMQDNKLTEAAADEAAKFLSINSEADLQASTSIIF